MTKYGKEILLESKPYKTVRFTVGDCSTKEDADKELKEWIKDYPKLLEVGNNKKILAMVLK